MSQEIFESVSAFAREQRTAPPIQEWRSPGIESIGLQDGPPPLSKTGRKKLDITYFTSGQDFMPQNWFRTSPAKLA